MSGTNGAALALVPDDEAMWRLVAQGDLRGLSDSQKSRYYLHLCESMGLNPATQPFEYMTLNNKMILYAKRTATDQLRKIHGVSIVGKPSIIDDGEYITAEVTVQDRSGRNDFEIGSVAVGAIKGEARANARMKALTKAKRRATLSICGLGMLDETEVETIPGARYDLMATATIASTPLRSDAPDATEITDAETGEIIEATANQPNGNTDKPDDPRARAMRNLHAEGRDRGLDHNALHRLALERFGVDSLTALVADDLGRLVAWVKVHDATGWQVVGGLIGRIANARDAETRAEGLTLLREAKAAMLDADLLRDKDLAEVYRRTQAYVRDELTEVAPEGDEEPTNAGQLAGMPESTDRPSDDRFTRL